MTDGQLDSLQLRGAALALDRLCDQSQPYPTPPELELIRRALLHYKALAEQEHQRADDLATELWELRDEIGKAADDEAVDARRWRALTWNGVGGRVAFGDATARVVPELWMTTVRNPAKVNTVGEAADRLAAEQGEVGP